VTDGRKRIARVLATLCITALSGSVLVAAPTYAEPDIGTVQTRVDKLYHEAEQASERYNDARLEMQQAQTRLTALRADLERQQDKVDSVRSQVAAAVVSQYQGQALSATTQVLLSEDPDAFLDQLTTVSEYNDQQTQIMADFAVQAKQLEMRQAAARRELSRIAATKKQLGREKAEIDEKAGEAKALLGRLEAEAAAKARAEARAKAQAEARLRRRRAQSFGRPPRRAHQQRAHRRQRACRIRSCRRRGAVRAGPGGRRLRLRRCRTERLRLLGAYDDGVGTGGRGPATLLGWADGLGHVGLTVAAPAG
jgi:peptidoglycan hydrolase CwlO-like protein